MPILDWLNRAETVKVADKVPYRLLEVDASLSYGDNDSPNMLIQGDNLEALKALLPYYAGQVKCIFIDPPYNTKSAFEHYDDNLEHAEWLNMMYPRLELLRELLTEDGSIWITLDDNESHYLKVVMDEIFGRKNFIANVVWQKKYTVANDAKFFSDNHDHVLVYAKSKEIWKRNLLERSDEMNARYKNPDKHPKGVWKSTPLHAKSGSEKSKNFSFTFKNGTTWSPPPGTFPRFSVETLSKMDALDEIWFGKDGRSLPSRKTFLSELSNDGTPPVTIWLSDEAGNNHEAKTEVKSFNSFDVFSTPKPEKLLQRIIHISTHKDDLVLDSFLGSGTTAAVAQKMGRRYIGIEMGEHARTHCAPRLHKVVDGEQGGISEAVNWQGGGGFKFYNLADPIFDAEGNINPKIKFPHLAAHIWFSETKTAYQAAKSKSPLLGVDANGTAYYLLYNGILGDKSVSGGNVLTNVTLRKLMEAHKAEEAMVIYGEASRLSPARLKELNIVFKQTPYDLKAR